MAEEGEEGVKKAKHTADKWIRGRRKRSDSPTDALFLAYVSLTTCRARNEANEILTRHKWERRRAAGVNGTTSMSAKLILT